MHHYVPLSPTTFLERTGRAFPEREAVVHAGESVCFGKLLQRARRLADVLHSLGVEYGDRVGLLSGNTLQTIEAHFAIPALGALIVSLNPWLPSKDIADQLSFCEATTLIVSEDFVNLHGDIFTTHCKLRNVIVFGASDEIDCGPMPVLNYEKCLAKASDRIALDQAIRSEFDPVAINFTSGTTGFPKGVLFSHRAAYLHAMGQVLMLGLNGSSRYLWTLPMFHVNGWGHMWATVAVAAPQIVISGNTPAEIKQIKAHGATHLAGAPRLVRSLVDKPGAESVLRNCTIMTGGAAPSPSLINQLADMGARLIHQYGLNETCGPYVVCEEQESWKHLPGQAVTEKRMRQGVAAIHAGTGLRVVDTDMRDVPADGTTLGEVIMAGNTVAIGYYNNSEATRKAFVEGWFHTGDMAVVHADNYIEIKDRIKDLIYVETEYGWENISSIEVENTISRYSGVKDVAVIGMSGGNNGKESTLLMAYLEKLPGSGVSEEELRQYCMQELAVYKRPHHFFFAEIPKTATGKVRKDLLLVDASARIDTLKNL